MDKAKSDQAAANVRKCTATILARRSKTEESFNKLIATAEAKVQAAGKAKGEDQQKNSQKLEELKERHKYTFGIDDKGRIKQAPALTPSPNGTYKSIDETFFYLKKKLEPKA